MNLPEDAASLNMGGVEAYSEAIRRLPTPRHGPEGLFKDAHDRFMKAYALPSDTENRFTAAMGILTTRIALNATDADLAEPWNNLVAVMAPPKAGVAYVTLMSSADAFDAYSRHERAAKFRSYADRVRALPGAEQGIQATQALIRATTAQGGVPAQQQPPDPQPQPKKPPAPAPW